MARRLLAALALAHGATALFEGFVDVLVRVDIQVSPSLFGGVVQAAGDSGADACDAAGAVVNACEDSGVLDATAVVADARSCLCCFGTTAISAVYSKCSTYAAAVGASSVKTAASLYYDVCKREGLCTGGIVGTATAVKTLSAPTALTTLRTSMPTACSSMIDIYSSCYAEMDGFLTARAREVASCFCPNQGGQWDTAFEDFAKTCAPFAKTAFPGDYSVITRFETFCDAYPPATGLATNTNALVFTTVGTRTGDGFGVTSATSSSTASTASGAAASSATSTSTSTAFAAPGTPLPGFLAWAANLATFVLSFFILI